MNRKTIIKMHDLFNAQNLTIVKLNSQQHLKEITTAS
jgi:hypothetical protein